MRRSGAAARNVSVPSLLAIALAAALAVPAGAETKEEGVDADPAVQAIDRFIEAQAIDRSRSGWKTDLPKPEIVEFPEGKQYFWVLRTDVGDVRVRLMPDVAPMHVTSTLYLTRLGVYDGTVFHRIIPDFMAQGGDPLGTGTGGPGYEYPGEFDPSVRHDRPGLLSMANAGPGTDGSQFFLTFVETPWLDGKHTIFGEVTDGMEAVKALEERGTRGGRPTETVRIREATIEVE